MTSAPVEEVRANVEQTIRDAAKGSGFILSLCNDMIDIIPEESVHAMYDVAENFDVGEL
jgi:uroporphyrinogen decarboxylase